MLVDVVLYAGKYTPVKRYDDQFKVFQSLINMQLSYSEI